LIVAWKGREMPTDSRGLKQYPQEKRNTTVHNVEWMRKLAAAVETHPELFREVIGPLWDARLEAQQEVEGLREECLALLAALAEPRPPIQ
jgi:hypothetical protein